MLSSLQKKNQAIKNCNNAPHCNNFNKEGQPSSSRNCLKFLQFNINSINTSLDKLWRYQKENNYNGIFLQETNYTGEKALGNLKHWKSQMHTNAGFGVGTLTPIPPKNVFRDNYINNDLEIIWNEMYFQNKDILIGNMYITPGNKNQQKILDKGLERRNEKNFTRRFQ